MTIEKEYSICVSALSFIRVHLRVIRVYLRKKSYFCLPYCLEWQLKLFTFHY